MHVVERASMQLVVFFERQERHRFVSNQRCAVSLTLWLIQNFADGSLPSFEIGRKVHVVRGKYKDETGEIFAEETKQSYQGCQSPAFDGSVGFTGGYNIIDAGRELG